MPRGGTLKEVLGSIPATHGVVFALSRRFAPRPDDGASFAERMTARVSPPVAINDPSSPYRPHLGLPTVVTGQLPSVMDRIACRAVAGGPFTTGIRPTFSTSRSVPLVSGRTRERDARWELPIGPVRNGLASKRGRKSAARFRTLVVDDATLERGLAEGSLVLDVRLRDALRALGGGVAPVVAESDPEGVVAGNVAVDGDIVHTTVRRRARRLRSADDVQARRGRHPTSSRARADVAI